MAHLDAAGMASYKLNVRAQVRERCFKQLSKKRRGTGVHPLHKGEKHLVQSQQTLTAKEGKVPFSPDLKILP